MGKIYFEMNDKERQLRLIGNVIDYAICVFGEGMDGTGEYQGMSTEEVTDTQYEISGKLIEVQAGIEKMLKAVVDEDEEEETQYAEEKDSWDVTYRKIENREGLSILAGCNVQAIYDVNSVVAGTNFTLHNEKDGKCVDLIIEDDGEMLLSDWY